jgi:meiotic recombination protein SPO11
MGSQEILFEELYELEMLELLNKKPWTKIGSSDTEDHACLQEQRDAHVKKCIIELFNVLFRSSYEKCADIYLPNERSSANLTFCSQRGLHIRPDPILNRRLTPNRRARYMLVLSHIYALIENRQNSTKRHVYYALSEYFEQQNSCNSILHELSALIGCPLPDMRVITTSKALIAGPLQLRFPEFEVDCSSHANGLLIPSNLWSMTALRSTATYALVIEKDSIFQQLANEHKLLSRAILLTGKGYPDVNVRCLLRLIADRLRIPIYVLVDCDVYGMEIFCIYRFGSLKLAAHCDHLAVNNVRLLGLLPSEVQRLKLTGGVKFNDKDWNKLQSLTQRPYVQQLPRLHHEMCVLQQIGNKIGLQALSQIEHGPEFLSDYVEKRIREEKWL